MSEMLPIGRFSPSLSPFEHSQSHGSAVRVPISSLHGRDDLIVQIQALLDGDDTRLLTLTGPGGIGKTRLALEIALRVQGDFAHGVCVVPLDSIHEPELVPGTIADALGIREGADLPISETLATALRHQHRLLVLDNLEQVAGAGPWVAGLLMECPRVKVLVTSRSLLYVQGERHMPVPSLPLPTVGSDHRESIDDLANVPSVALFVERARAVQHDFTLNADNAATVREICHRLEGLPLAIELAAARVNVLSPAAILVRLRGRLELLTGKMRDVPLRLRTMRNAIAWSYELLPPSEQAVFRRLSIFVNDFSLDAAEAVIMPGIYEQRDTERGFAEPAGLALDYAASLLDQSLLLQASGEVGDPTFRMLATIREYGLEQLVANDEFDEVAARHADWFLAFAEQAEPYLTGAEQVAWLDRIESVYGDLRQAFTWLHDHGEYERSVRLARALWRFGYVRSYLTETRGWLDTALKTYLDPTRMRAAALNAAGVLASVQGDIATAIACHTEALEIGRAQDDRYCLAMALNGLGNVAEVEENRNLAFERYGAARDVFRDIGHVRGVAVMLTNLGNLHWEAHELARATELHEEARRLFTEVGDPRGLAWSVTNLGTLALERGDLDTSTLHYQDALSQYRELGDRLGILETLEGLANLAARRDQPERQGTLLAAAATIRQTIHVPVGPGDRGVYDAMLSSLRVRLGARFAPVWAAGNAMTLDEAIAAARSADPMTSELPTPVTPPQDPVRSHGLTHRELEVLKLMVNGLSNQEIADQLFVSRRTVTSHTSNILGKLGVTSRSAVVAYAIRNNLDEPS